jgi:S-formylglutathione hydrolase FrmB
MGGYGAMKMLLNHPDRFAAGGTFSGAVGQKDGYAKLDRERFLIFGDEAVKGTADDLAWLAEQVVAQGKPMPRVYQTCGTEDTLYEHNVAFRAHLEKLGYDLTVDFRPGAHEWGFWDVDIANYLRWLEPDLKRGDPE